MLIKFYHLILNNNVNSIIIYHLLVFFTIFYSFFLWIYNYKYYINFNNTVYTANTTIQRVQCKTKNQRLGKGNRNFPFSHSFLSKKKLYRTLIITRICGIYSILRYFTICWYFIIQYYLYYTLQGNKTIFNFKFIQLIYLNIFNTNKYIIPTNSKQ